MNTAGTTSPLLSVKNLSRHFPGVLALDEVSFDILPGEVHALVGENGAGKSTLINILAGIIQPSNGTLEVRGRRTVFHNPLQAQQAGIATIFQEFNLLPHLSVGENIFLTREPRRGPVIDWQELHRQAAAIIKELQITLDSHTLVRDLPVAQQQLVEIARALSMRPQVIVMDEPTAALSEREVEQLLALVRSLAQQGVGIMYVSHRLSEVFSIAQRITVLRDGRHIKTGALEDFNEEQVVALMVGRELLHTERSEHHPGEVVLAVDNLVTGNAARGVSFELHAGEVLGLAGLMGSGCTQVLEALFGLRPITKGSVRVAGKTVKLTTPREALHYGIGFVPEDRKHGGILPDVSVLHNLSIAVLKRVLKGGIISRKKENALLAEYGKQLHIRYSDPAQFINNLSGGNQQKVILARSLAQHCKVLLLSEPTRGVDVGAKAEIYALIEDLVKEGIAILLQSSELPEILRLSDRCIVFAAGQPQGELTGADLNQATIMHLATGLAAEQGPASENLVS